MKPFLLGTMLGFSGFAVWHGVTAIITANKHQQQLTEYHLVGFIIYGLAFAITGIALAHTP